MSAEEEAKDEGQLEQSEIRGKGKLPGVRSALHNQVTAQYGSHGLAIPKLDQSEIREGKPYESRPAVGSELDLKRRPILSHQAREESSHSEMEEAFDATLLGASSSSEPPPDMGQTLPLPEALRAAAQGSEEDDDFDFDLASSGLASERPDAPSGKTQALHSPTEVRDEVVERSSTEVAFAQEARAPSFVMPNGGDSQLGRAATEAVPLPDRADTHVGQYEIIRKLGEGGMGVVYLARDVRLGRRVAIKVLRTQDRELTRRFIIEAKTTARCTHENIVIIHEAGEHCGSPFMVLEYLEGKSLSDYQEHDPPTIPHAVEIMVGVVRALVRAHEEGIVHRDLKPDNIFITDSGTVKVLDFGIAKLLGVDGPMSQAALADGPRSVSNTGVAGTAGYMSPEQWQTPSDVDHRADIWAVGCTLFELLTRRNPLAELGDPLSVATFLAGPTPMPSVADYGARVPSQLAAIVSRCLEKDRSKRFADARSLLKALEPYLPGRRQALDEQLELGPFAGLRAFQEEDAARFFGRTKELGTLLSRLRETPLMATVGPSGVGKSSFLRAGVIPALKNSGAGWEVVVCRPGRSPFLSLLEHLRPLLDERNSRGAKSLPPRATDEQVVERMMREPGFLGALLRQRCRNTGGRLMVFLDQFEELYTLGASVEERLAFTRALLGAADDAVSPVRVMLSVRADFLGRTTEDSDFVTALTKGLFFLGPPSEDGLREALVRPLEMVGYRFENSVVVEEMIRFLDGTPNGLPLLQFTASQLWEARDPQNRVLTVQSYRGMGGVEGALVSHADRVYNGLSPNLQVLCRTLFMHLVTQERTRAVRTMKELSDLADNGRELKSLVEQLVESRLWVVTTHEGDPTVEVVHESLITSWPSLRRWLDESHEDSVFVDQLMMAANQWVAKKRDVGLLWRGEMVVELELFLRRYRGNLPELVDQFAQAVRHQELRATRLRRGLQIGGVVALLGCLVAASIGLYVVNQERRKADRNAQIAEKNERIAQQRLAEQVRAERQRRKAEQERKDAQKKTFILEDKVKLNAEELAAKNIELEDALDVARRQQKAAKKAQAGAEVSAEEAREAKARAEATAKELKVLLDKERERSERLNAQIGTLVEDL